MVDESRPERELHGYITASGGWSVMGKLSFGVVPSWALGDGLGGGGQGRRSRYSFPSAIVMLRFAKQSSAQDTGVFTAPACAAPVLLLSARPRLRTAWWNQEAARRWRGPAEKLRGCDRGDRVRGVRRPRPGRRRLA